jgi:hypothetical protein
MVIANWELGMGQTGHWPNRALAKQGIGYFLIIFYYKNQDQLTTNN